VSDGASSRDGARARDAAARISEAIINHAATLNALDPARPETWDAQRTAFDGGVAVFDASGNISSATPSRAVWEARRAKLPSISVRREFFADVVNEGGATHIVIAVPRDAQMIAGAFTLPPLANLAPGPHSVAYIVDANETIIAHSNPTRVGENLSPSESIAQVRREEAGATFHHSASGAELVVGYAPIPPTGWRLLIEEPWAEVVAPMFQYSVLLPLVLVLVAVVALGAIYFGIRNVHQPMQNLAQMANRIAFGDYDAAARSVGGVREIEELRETLDAMAKQVRAAQDAMQNYITAILRGQEDERMRLARELHDDTIQSLIALQQRIEMTQKALSRDPVSAAEKIKELRELVGTTLVSVRHFVRDLRPTYLADLGLIPALETLARESNADFQVHGKETRLDAERELALYRIVQESLRNIAKHAHAHHVAVTLAFETDAVTATIEDDGVGFAAFELPNAYVQAGHFGLMGMQERAQLFGGNVYVKSERGKGTKVVAYVPIKN
jgi:two-component system sensor histidine kinase UhpB